MIVIKRYYTLFIKRFQATLGALRAKVLEATNVAIERQRLIFKGKVLNDDSKTLSALGLVDGNVLHMVERAPVLANANAAPLAPHPDEQRGQHHHRGAVRNVIVGNLPIQRQDNYNEQHIRVRRRRGRNIVFGVQVEIP